MRGLLTAVFHKRWTCSCSLKASISEASNNLLGTTVIKATLQQTAAVEADRGNLVQLKKGY